MSTTRLRIYAIYLVLIAAVLVPIVGVLTIDDEPTPPTTGQQLGSAAGETATRLGELLTR